MNIFDKSPIIAIATAPGRGGIGVIRLSGPNLLNFQKQLFNQELRPRHAHFLPFNSPDGEQLDEGIAIYFKGPHSYTGEDVIELQGHGGPAVLKRILQTCLKLGSDIKLRLAEPGEFTQRAFLNGRMDLAQAEAVADLIEANSTSAAKSAVSSLSGAFSNEVNKLADQIIHLRMLVEATLDFPEEEIEFLEKYQAADRLTLIQKNLHEVIEISKQGMILREGLHVVLAGQPNVGKSSLLNALAGDDIAIVTDIAGTTRDRVIQAIDLDGIPLHIVDTAGLRQTEDTVESIGIQRTWMEIEKADLILHLKESIFENDPAEQEIINKLPKKTPIINIINKIDLYNEAQLEKLKKQYPNHLFISAKKNLALNELKKKLLDMAGWNAQQETPWLARERHLIALEEANEHLDIAKEHATFNDQVLDLFAEELRLAHESLNRITGQFTSDDLLGEIFSSFCIGK